MHWLTEKNVQSLHALVMGGGKARAKPTPYRDEQNVTRFALSASRRPVAGNGLMCSSNCVRDRVAYFVRWPRRPRGMKQPAQHLKVDASSKLQRSRTARAEHLSHSTLGLSKPCANQTIAVTGKVRDIKHVEHFADQHDR
jgi:hypothetical protein